MKHITVGVEQWHSISAKAFDSDFFCNPEFKVKVQHCIDKMAYIVAVHLKEKIAADILAEISFPSTWVDALKAALLNRFPKIFGNLCINYEHYNAIAYYKDVKMPEHCTNVGIRKEYL